jgi:hypothetical protein
MDTVIRVHICRFFLLYLSNPANMKSLFNKKNAFEYHPSWDGCVSSISEKNKLVIKKK